MDVSKVLTEVADFYEANPKAWTRAAWGRNAAGRSVEPNNPAAVQWCIMGRFEVMGLTVEDIRALNNASYAYSQDNLMTHNDSAYEVNSVIVKLRLIAMLSKDNG